MQKVIHLEFYYSSVEFKLFEQYGDVNRILQLIKEVENAGIPCRIVDTKDMTDDERSNVYLTSCVPAVKNKYPIRQVFGSKKYSGTFFGTKVPALLIYGGGRYPEHVFPHKEKGQLVTIEMFLETLIKK